MILFWPLFLCATTVEASFNPNSTLTSYADQGVCGPRGDDAAAILGQCLNGYEVLEDVRRHGGAVAITIDGCDYLSYTVYACKNQASGATNTDVVLSCHVSTEQIIIASAYISSPCGDKLAEIAHTTKAVEVCDGRNSCIVGWNGGGESCGSCTNIRMSDPCPGQAKTLHVVYLCKPRCTVILYDDKNFNGTAVTFFPGWYSKVNPINDAASSAKVDPGCQAILYEHTHYVNGKIRVYSPGEYGSLWLDNKVSSMKVYETSAGWWYASGVDENCNTGCEAHGLNCTEDELYNHNSDIDSSGEVLALIGHVGGSTTAGSCVTYTSADIPMWTPVECGSSPITRAMSSIDCGQVPSPAGQSRQRLCYCHYVASNATPIFSGAAASLGLDGTITGTSTSAAPTFEVIEITVTLYVSNAENVSLVAEFAREPEVEAVLREAFATLLDIDASWIHNLRIVEQRRLSSQSIPAGQTTGSWNTRQTQNGSEQDTMHVLHPFVLLGERESRRTLDVTTKSGIVITFDVIPQTDDGSDHIIARLLMDRFNEVALEEATVVINQVISSGVLGSKDYELTLIAKNAVPGELSPTPTSSPVKKDDGQTVIIIMCIAISMFVISLAILLCYVSHKRHKRRAMTERLEAQRLMDARRHHAASLDKPVNDSLVMHPPHAISSAHKLTLCNVLSGLLEYSDPLVFVCFAVGKRDDDDVGCGPGLFYAAAVIQSLHERAIPSYCSMPDAMDDAACLRMLCGEDTPCKLLVVLETRALYSSIKCLQQIHSAVKNDISITRLRFEETPLLREQWSDLPVNDSTWVDMRTAMTHELQLRRVVPDDAGLVQDLPCCLQDFAEDLRSRYLAMRDSDSSVDRSIGFIKPVDLAQSEPASVWSNRTGNPQSRTVSNCSEKAVSSISSPDLKRKKKAVKKSASASSRDKSREVQPLSVGKTAAGKSTRPATKKGSC